MPTTISLDDAPEDALLSQLEVLLRVGLPPGVPGTEWEAGDERCPAGHWLMPEGARCYRYDSPGVVEAPGAVLYLEQDSRRYDPVSGGLWWVYPVVDLLWPRDLTSVETRQLLFSLRKVFTADLGGTVPGGQQSALARLSVAPASGVPGVGVKVIRDVVAERAAMETGHPLLTLRFTVLAEGLWLVP